MFERNSKIFWLGLSSSAALILINIIGYYSAYALINYRPKNKIALGYPRPENRKTPADLNLSYQSDRIPLSNQGWIETWWIETTNPVVKGTIILFHGKGSSKSSLLPSARVFQYLGYHTLLVDFRGAGGSSGDNTTVGFRESQDVVAAFKQIKRSQPNQPIFLYGISMGSAATLRAVSENNIQPDGIILELPFATLLSAVKARLSRTNLPAFPFGELIVFWGGIQAKFNGFAHNPVDYARRVKCPALILHGELDSTVDFLDIEQLYKNLDGRKQLVNFSQAGHQILVTVEPKLWEANIKNFLDMSTSNENHN